MRARVDAKAFAGAAKTAARVARGAHLPALFHLRIAASADTIEVVGGDGDLYLSTDVTADIEGAGTVVVPAATLARVADTFTGDITIEAVDGDLLIVGADGEASLRLGDVDAYPVLDWPTDEPVPLGDAWARIASISYAMSLRPAQTGQSTNMMRFGDGEASATDSYRAARTSVPEAIPTCWASQATVAAAVKTLTDPVSMVTTDRLVGWTDKTTTIISRQAMPDGDWRGGITSLFTQKRDLEVTCDAGELVDAVRAVEALDADPKTAPVVRLAMRDGDLEVSRSTQDVGATRRTITAAGEVPEWLALTGSFLRDALATIDSDVRIAMVDWKKSVRIYGADGIDQLLMPVRLPGAPT